LVSFILICLTLAADAKTKNMENVHTKNSDKETLSALNGQFIRNFLKQDVKAHSEIIHPDFVCIESNGAIVSRETYLQNWATDHDNSGYTSFTYTDEHIRIFGSTAMVRAKTIYTKNVDGKTITGYTIYTDTYFKENGKWKCIQVQITPVKK
jgi:ketosteroid isomerase-like protein